MPRLCLLSLVLVLMFLSASCGEDVPLSPSQPLQDRQLIDALYGAQTGPHAVMEHRDLTLEETEDQRQLTFNLYYPETGTDLPIVLFSHGNWSNKDSYDQIVRHWVSHGYIVLAPDHLDCCHPVKGIFNSLRFGQWGLIDQRVKDFQRLYRQLETIASEFGLGDRVDLTRLATAGHSFGAFTAQQFTGAAALDPDRDEYIPAPDIGVSATVAISPPGPMFDTITSESWRKMHGPALVATGTWDIQPQFWPDWRMHLMSYEKSLEGQHYALVTQGADHYLGNLICRTEREAPPQHDALAVLRLTSTAFLDAHLKNDTNALRFLDSERLNEAARGFTKLSRR